MRLTRADALVRAGTWVNPTLPVARPVARQMRATVGGVDKISTLLKVSRGVRWQIYLAILGAYELPGRLADLP